MKCCYTLKQVRDRLGYSHNYLLLLVKADKIPGAFQITTPNGLWHFRMADFDSWLNGATAVKNRLGRMKDVYLAKQEALDG